MFYFICFNTSTFRLGEYSGSLAFYNELVILPTIPLWGMVSDKIGRRIVFSIGIFIIGLALLLTSIVTTWVQLICVRLFFALGASATGAMLTAVLGDYPHENSKGKTGGVVGLMAGVGAIFSVFILLRIPRWSKIEHVILAGQVMFWVAGSLCIIAAYILYLGLKSGTKHIRSFHPPILVTIKEGLFAAKDPKVALSYLASLTARGDAIVASMFLTLWVHHYYQELGKPEQEALARSGMISGIAQTCALIFAPVVGFMSDRISKVLSVIIMGCIGFIGYMFMFFLKTPTGAPVIIAAILVGCGEIGMTVSSQVLIAHSSPKDVRGSTSGFFGIFASIGIIIGTRLGGHLFDVWSPGAPFFIFGILNALTAIAGVGLLIADRISKKKQLKVIDD